MYHYTNTSDITCQVLFSWYHIDMAISDKNKRYFVTISKEDYEKLKEVAEREHRSVSAQSLHFILQGIKLSEEKRG